jgi:hypothetical protein
MFAFLPIFVMFLLPTLFSLLSSIIELFFDWIITPIYSQDYAYTESKKDKIKIIVRRHKALERGVSKGKSSEGNHRSRYRPAFFNS